METCYTRTRLPTNLWLFAKLQKVRPRDNVKKEISYCQNETFTRSYSRIHLLLIYLGINLNIKESNVTSPTCEMNQENDNLLIPQMRSSCFYQIYIQVKQHSQQFLNFLHKQQTSLSLSSNFIQQISTSLVAWIRSNFLANLSQHYTTLMPLLNNHKTLFPPNQNPVTDVNTDINQLLLIKNLLASNIFSQNLRLYSKLMSVENTDHLNNFFINVLSDHQQNIGKIQNFTLLSNFFYVTQLLQIHESLSQPPRSLSVNTLGYILNKWNSINKDTLPVDQNASSFLNKYYIHSFENELPSYDLVTRITQNSIKQVNEVPILVDDTILRFPSFIDKVVSLHYPSLSTVEQVNSSIESQTTQNSKRFRFDILYVQDEAKTRFTCTVSDKIICPLNYSRLPRWTPFWMDKLESVDFKR
ncbi:hypothetical protein Smp_128800 [Schistosoma mansoni]|uniref:hypothetical protein n=1 Tax=Schistosoma mansoni TaxID=6183 RepID=UPI00022DC0BF|nr:hypothetical protein Smp_128800 [Schistosoma mansoni]|eukprot:XP_018650101.1 hypothetical protein Smp_128800 [Schistosoma mansoni]